MHSYKRTMSKAPAAVSDAIPDRGKTETARWYTAAPPPENKQPSSPASAAVCRYPDADNEKTALQSEVSPERETAYGRG